MSGTVKGTILNPDSNVMANCQLFMYRRTDGALLGSAVSDESGAYEITHTAQDGEKVFVVCLDNDDSPDFEGLVRDRVTIESGSGEPTDPEVTYPTSAMVLRSSDQVSQVSLQLSKGTHNIDWGDGTIDTDVSGELVHNYATLAKHTIIVEKSSNEGGTNGNNTMVMNTAMGIEEVVQWYDQGYEVLGFNLNSQTLQDTLVKVPPVEPLVFAETQNPIFMRCSVFNDPNVLSWNVSSYTSLAQWFQECHAFNQPIGETWNFSNKTILDSMFYNCHSFNQDLGMIDVSQVTDMYNMFYGCTVFNQDLSQWCVTNITEEPGSFRDGSALTNEHCPVWGTCPSG